jgi:acyl-CoA reductase-like NAD-dependent aldehyde dehydrogenase
MRIFLEEIFGPVVSVTTFKDDAVRSDHDQRRLQNWDSVFRRTVIR